MKSKRKNIKYKKKHNKTNIKRYILTKKPIKKTNYLTKKRNMRFKGGMDNDKKRKRHDLEDQDLNNNEEICPICTEPFQPNEETITTSCNHKFHKDELIAWCRRLPRGRYTCPNCRKNISEEMQQYLPSSIQPIDLTRINNRNRILILTRRTEVALRNITSEPSPEISTLYQRYINLFPNVEQGGSRQKIQNILFKLFDDNRYFNPNMDDLMDCYLYIIQNINIQNFSTNTTYQKAIIISQIMNNIDDNENYTDMELKNIIIDNLSSFLGNYLVNQ